MHPVLAKWENILNQKLVISVDEAQQKISERLVSLPPELVKIEDANGRVLAEQLQSDRDLPPFNRSTFDGIALCYQSLAQGLRIFPVTATAYAGSPKIALTDLDSCVEIMTGAPVPDNANCVVKIEDLKLEDGIATLNDGVELFEGFGIHPHGSDCPAGKVLLKPGCTLSAKELSIAASIGKSQLLVSKIPRISIVTTGDELTEVSASPLPHQIRRSNDLALQFALQSAGYQNVSRHHILDDLAETERAVQSILQDTDILILAGGVSKGKRDFLPAALESVGVAKTFQWVSQRPGKPLWFGDVDRNGKRTFVFALPGNPVSCFTCLHRFVLPTLAEITGKTGCPPQFVKLRSEFNFNAPLTLFLPVSLSCDETGQLWAAPLPFNTSGDFISVAQTQGFVELPSSKSVFPEGSSHRFYNWSV